MVELEKIDFALGILACTDPQFKNDQAEDYFVRYYQEGLIADDIRPLIAEQTVAFICGMEWSLSHNYPFNRETVSMVYSRVDMYGINANGIGSVIDLTMAVWRKGEELSRVMDYEPRIVVGQD